MLDCHYIPAKRERAAAAAATVVGVACGDSSSALFLGAEGGKCDETWETDEAMALLVTDHSSHIITSEDGEQEEEGEEEKKVD